MRLGEIAEHMSGRLLGEDRFVTGIAPLYAAGATDLSVLAWPKDIRPAKHSPAAALVTPLSWAADYADEISASLIVVDSIASAFSVLAKLCSKGCLCRQPRITRAHIHPSALISPSAVVSAAHIGANTRIGPNAVIDDDVAIGSHGVIGPGVIIHSESRVGDHCSVGAHSVIGSAAFAPDGEERLQSLASLGRVSIGNHVRIGALCTIDRGLLGATTILDFCQLDSQVHIGHDVHLGHNVLIAAQSGLAGFVRVGPQVTIGGQAGVAPHVVVGAGARVSGKTLVHKNVGAYEICSGNPALPHELYLRAYKQNFNTKLGLKHERN